MRANTLRTGNKVQDKYGFIFYVVSIHIDGTIYCDFEGNEGDVWEFDNNNPCIGIELTEEILLKLGFTLRGVIFRINNLLSHQFDINYSSSRDMFYYDSSKYGIYTEVEIKYLHQLQNLYFALTNEELTIKL